jgi:hypothetical protein
MQVKGKTISHYRILFLVCLAGVISAHLVVTPSWASEKYARSAVVSLDVKNEPLGVVLDKISSDTGHKILVNREWADLPVTARLHNVTVEEGLRRLLKNFNYALVFQDNEKRISIEIHGFSSNIEPVERTAVKQRERQALLQEKEVDSRKLEVIPPAEPGGRGITEGELEALEALREKIDPGDLEVLPPEEPEGRGITQRELKALEALRKKTDPGELEVIPPPEPKK